jgi:hypothetical protein
MTTDIKEKRYWKKEMETGILVQEQRGKRKKMKGGMRCACRLPFDSVWTKMSVSCFRIVSKIVGLYDND